MKPVFFSITPPGMSYPKRQVDRSTRTAINQAADQICFSGAKGTTKVWPEEERPPLLAKPDLTLFPKILAGADTDYLSKEEEIELGKAIQWGLYARDPNARFPNHKLRKRWVDIGQTAENELARRYAGLTEQEVRQKAKKYAHRLLPNLYEDLQESANLKLRKMLHSFNPSKNCKFSTIYVLSLGRYLAQEAQRMKSKARYELSLDAMHKDGNTSLGARVADPKSISPDAEAIEAEKPDLRKALEQAMAQTLDERQRFIVLAMMEEGATLESTGKSIGLTRERVRQILKKSYQLLQKSPLLRDLVRMPADESGLAQKPQKTDPETRNRLQERALTLYFRICETGTQKGLRPEFMDELEGQVCRQHGNYQVFKARALSKPMDQTLIDRLEQFKDLPTKRRMIAMLLAEDFSETAITETLGVSASIIGSVQRAMAGEKPKTQDLLHRVNPRSVTPEMLTRLDLLAEPIRRVVEMRHGIGLKSPLAPGDIAQRILKSRDSAASMQILWMYACGVQALKNVAEASDMEKVHQALDELPRFQKKILQTHFGLKDGFPLTMTEVTRRLNGDGSLETQPRRVNHEYLQAMNTLMTKTGLSRESLSAILMASCGVRRTRKDDHATDGAEPFVADNS